MRAYLARDELAGLGYDWSRQFPLKLLNVVLKRAGELVPLLRDGRHARSGVVVHLQQRRCLGKGRVGRNRYLGIVDRAKRGPCEMKKILGAGQNRANLLFLVTR